MATQPQGHPPLSAEHVTTPQTNIQLPTTTVPLNIPQNPQPPPSPDSNSHPIPMAAARTPSHLSTSTAHSNIDKPIPSQPHAIPNVVSNEPLPASDPEKLPAAVSNPTQLTNAATESPPKRRKNDVTPHQLPRTQAVVDALNASPFRHSQSAAQQPSQPPQNTQIEPPVVAQSTAANEKASPQPQQPQNFLDENSVPTQPAINSHDIANASLAATTSVPVLEPTQVSAPSTSNETEKSDDATKAQQVVEPTPEPARETNTTTNAESKGISYVPNAFSSAPLVSNDARTTPVDSDSSQCTPIPNSSIDASTVTANVTETLPNSRKRASSTTSEPQGNGEIFVQEADPEEPDSKRLKPDEDSMTNISSGTAKVEDEDGGKPFARSEAPTDPSSLKPATESAAQATETAKEPNIGNAVENDSDAMQVDTKLSKASKSTKSERSVSGSSAPRSGISLPVLRSSPITVERDIAQARASVTKAEGADGDDSEGRVERANVKEDGEEPAPTVTKKKKSVSWAKEEKLVEVQFIDNRMELVRSWDANSQITLPFAPATLHMFQQALKDQEAAKRKEGQPDGKGAESMLLRSMPKLTSFEEARKREHDMEQERARQAREELKERLNAMTTSTSWKTPTAIVLPAECRIEEETVQRFELVGDDSYYEHVTEPDGHSPPSPPYKPYDGPRPELASVPLIPLSDRLNQNEDTGYESQSPADNAGSREYTRSESRQEFMRETPSRGRPKPESGADYDASSGSSKGYHYSDTHKSDVGNLRHSSGSDAHMDQNSREQYDMQQNNYPGINPNSSSSQVQVVQHLLSALQSSGLLKPGSSSTTAANANSEYNRPSVPMHARAAPDGGYRESQHTDQREVRNRDGDTYENDNQEDERPRVDNPMRSQGMPTPDASIPPPLMAPAMGAPFPPGMQQPGMMDMMSFAGAMGPPPPGMPPMGMLPGGMPPGGIPPPPIGIPPLGMLQMMGLPVPMMSMPPGMQIPDGSQAQATPGTGGHSLSSTGRTGSGRVVETISRPKPKPPKQRKRCKYFGTKQGCRDGNACMFAHN